ncbi:hypothetical protein BD769DRAFT_1783567 [Suillus cothurnatus]|nr:hypothetical protein BD769DRAFT_1783567 [Suillus cothurnatus]
MVYSADDIAASTSLQFLAYRCAAMATFWTYDYACSFEEEWKFLHQSRWNKVKCLYIIARYVPFCLITTDLYLNFAPNENPDKCRKLINVYSCFSLMSIISAECIFVLRTYALWNNNRFVLAAMVSASVATIITSISIEFTTISTSYVLISAIPGITGCYRSSSGVQFFMPFLLLFIFELGLVSLTLIRAIQSWRSDNGPLYSVLVKHNIFYYACGLLLSAVNILMPVLFSNYAYHSFFEDVQFFLLAILATRMHLHLWHIDRNVHGSDALVYVSDILSPDQTL